MLSKEKVKNLLNENDFWITSKKKKKMKNSER